jgi:hypothetical protein
MPRARIYIETTYTYLLSLDLAPTDKYLIAYERLERLDDYNYDRI